MSSYHEIQDAIKTTLDADSWFDGTSSSILTTVVNDRLPKLRHNPVYQGFLYSELPALSIQAIGKEAEFNTVRELDEDFLVKVTLITRARDEQTGRDTHLDKVKEIERVLRKQVTSDNDLGIDAFVTNVNTEFLPIELADKYFIFVSETYCNVEVIATI